MYQRFTSLRDEGKIIFILTYKHSFEFIVFITKLGVRFAKADGNHWLSFPLL